ncbi:MAG TPA: hypothetical protein VIG66_08390 [Noviherbaspirillum sp.]
MRVFRADHLVTMAVAPIIWSVHFVLCYVLVSLGCALGWTESGILGMNAVEAGIALASLAALAMLGYTAALNMEKYRDAPRDASGANDPSAFVALNSVLLCGLSTVSLIWVAFPVAVLPMCAT